MIEFIIALDKKLLLLINSWHTPWLDSIINVLTNGFSWLPLFLVIIGWVIYKFRWQSITIFLLLGLVILLSDQISAGFFKPFFARLRPSHDPEIKDLLHLVNNYRGGQYGFVSSHATNAFGIATFLWITVRQKIGWIWIIFVWAAVFSYTRLYLGVHYPLDIIAGGLLGAIIGYTVYALSKFLPKQLSPINRADAL